MSIEKALRGLFVARVVQSKLLYANRKTKKPVNAKVIYNTRIQNLSR